MLIEYLQDAAQHLESAAKQLKTGAAQVRKVTPHSLLHVMMGLGLAGVLVVATLDASFIPLPIPGCTDILLIILAARQYTWIGLILLSTLGSLIGGAISYRVGAAGGVHMLEKRVSKKYFKRICRWVEEHALLAVALPAILPPPMPLSIFVISAGALKVPKRKFFPVFVISRFLRHSFCVWVGVKYGRHVLHEWNSFSAQWGERIEIGLWSIIGCALLYVVWYLWSHARQDRKVGEKTVWKALAEDS